MSDYAEPGRLADDVYVAKRVVRCRLRCMNGRFTYSGEPKRVPRQPSDTSEESMKYQEDEGLYDDGA